MEMFPKLGYLLNAMRTVSKCKIPLSPITNTIEYIGRKSLPAYKRKRKENCQYN